MKRSIGFLMLMLGLLVSTAAMPAFADSSSQLFAGCSQVPNSPICKDKNTTTNPANRIIKDATDVVSLIAGVTAVIMIIIGGLTMVTSGGNSEAVANARKHVLYAVIGLIIVALAWTLITFLTDQLIKT